MHDRTKQLLAKSNTGFRQKHAFKWHCRCDVDVMSSTCANVHFLRTWVACHRIFRQRLSFEDRCASSAMTASCLCAEGKVFAVWRPVLISEQDSRSLPDTELLQRLVAVSHSAQCWAVILSKGGHFSAAVFDLRPVPPQQHSKATAPLFKELAHKSYHRYVVRYAPPPLLMSLTVECC